ncbi:MAG TPA: DUF2306 domain-containing protein [Candidatus Polarisedimenticolia bacterium]|nr:DUF2306 domain-containing protein [Candidatus Polarisedimenticolia bacterium]
MAAHPFLQIVASAPRGMVGACALLLGPMQFSERLRQRFTKFHRVVGRFYVTGVFAAAPSAFTFSTSKSAWAAPVPSAWPPQWMPFCGCTNVIESELKPLL